MPDNSDGKLKRSHSKQIGELKNKMNQELSVAKEFKKKLTIMNTKQPVFDDKSDDLSSKSQSFYTFS